MRLHIFKYRLMLVLAMLVTFFSCTKDFPSNTESSDEVVLQSIKILNAGAAGNTVVEGVIDENTKAISFPRLDPETNFGALKFEATMSNGAKLDRNSYQFVFAEGESIQTGIIKVLNNKRFREYRVTIRINVPVFGADFTKPTIYDFTNNELGNPIYPTYTGALTRGAGFDGEHVLVVTRATGGPHLLKISDLRNNVISPITINQTGVSGGTFPVCAGAQVNGHTYITNLSGNSAASPLKIYHWTDPSAAPQLIWSEAIPNGGARLGDNMSANLDENGNGYFYFGDNPATRLVRLKVSNYTQISEPVTFTAVTGQSYTMSFNRVGNTSDYIYTGYETAIRVANESATVAYTLGSSSVPLRGSDAQVISFNNERYLIMTTAARTGSEPVVLYVYDITKGSTTTEALMLFDERADKSPIYQYSLLGPAGANCFNQTRYYITKDEEGKDKTLIIFSSHTDAGFVIVDFPKKTLDD